VDEFLKKIGEMFECILFTASLAKVSFSAYFKNKTRKHHNTITFLLDK
jgi:hypothetical protein